MAEGISVPKTRWTLGSVCIIPINVALQFDWPLHVSGAVVLVPSTARGLYIVLAVAHLVRPAENWFFNCKTKNTVGCYIHSLSQTFPRLTQQYTPLRSKYRSLTQQYTLLWSKCRPLTQQCTTCGRNYTEYIVRPQGVYC